MQQVAKPEIVYDIVLTKTMCTLIWEKVCLQPVSTVIQLSPGPNNISWL